MLLGSHAYDSALLLSDGATITTGLVKGQVNGVDATVKVAPGQPFVGVVDVSAVVTTVGDESYGLYFVELDSPTDVVNANDMKSHAQTLSQTSAKKTGRFEIGFVPEKPYVAFYTNIQAGTAPSITVDAAQLTTIK